MSIGCSSTPLYKAVADASFQTDSNFPRLRLLETRAFGDISYTRYASG